MIHIDLLDFGRALFGGILIGLSASILLAFSGRIAGISGILYQSVVSFKESGWRLAFLIGLLGGGTLLWKFAPDLVQVGNVAKDSVLIGAGLLVGFGSVLGNGCTSGHGVCGISRFSVRSFVATLVFMAAGAGVVFISRHIFLGGF